MPSSVRLPHDTAVSCGLLVNDLIANALKRAFPDDSGGTIEIALAKSDEQPRLTVRDDGVGMPSDIVPDRSQSLGLELVHTLAQQLAASFEFRSPGTEVALACKDPPRC